MQVSVSSRRRVMAAIAGVSLTAFGLGVFAIPLAATASAQAQMQTPPVKLDVPYVPTPQAVVDKMLELAKPTKDDFLIDLGSGDGRIVVTAAKKYGTRGLGIDINPERIAEANANAKKEGVESLVEFRQADLFETDFSKANVLTMYLLSSVNMKLRPKILSDLKPGTRVVSHAFDMGDWKPDTTEQVDGKTVYMWTIPQKKAEAPVQ